MFISKVEEKSRQKGNLEKGIPFGGTWERRGFSGVHEVCHDTGFRKSLAILGAPCTCLTHGHPAYNQRSQTKKKTIPAGLHRQLTLKELDG